MALKRLLAEGLELLHQPWGAAAHPAPAPGDGVVTTTACRWAWMRTLVDEKKNASSRLRNRQANKSPTFFFFILI